MISARKAKHTDVTTIFTYSHANTPLGQSEHAYYLSYFIKPGAKLVSTIFCVLVQGFSTAKKKALFLTSCTALAREDEILVFSLCARATGQLDDGVLRNLALLGFQHFVRVLLAGMLVDLDYKES